MVKNPRDVDATGYYSALMWAVSERHSDVAKLLVERGADGSAAASLSKGDPAVVGSYAEWELLLVRFAGDEPRR